MVNDKIHCLDQSHDVLTADGWKPIASVTITDRVATLVAGKLVYEEPLEVLHFPDFQGKMFHVRSRGVDLFTTMEHRMWVATGGNDEYGHVMAKDLVGKAVLYKRDAEWDAPDFQFHLPGRSAVPMDAWLDFFGIWLMRGYIKPGGARRHAVEIAFDEPTDELCVAALEVLGFRWDGRSWGDKKVITDRALYDYLEPSSVGAADKRLPDWAWSLSTRQALRLLNAILAGDQGAFPRLYTSSPILADDVSRLALHAGLSAIVADHETHWSVDVQTMNLPSTRPGKSTEEIVDFVGPVYCLSVRSEVFMVRRNGKPIWTGNSRAANGPVVLLTRQPAEGRARDGGLRLGEMELDCLWAHGLMHFLKERFVECSDNYRVFVCRRCGMIAAVNPEHNIHSCRACKNTTHFSELRIPYAAKLLVQEVQAMNIATRFLTAST